VHSLITGMHAMSAVSVVKAQIPFADSIFLVVGQGYVAAVEEGRVDAIRVSHVISSHSFV
jgi:hypothetical protein